MDMVSRLSESFQVEINLTSASNRRKSMVIFVHDEFSISSDEEKRFEKVLSGLKVGPSDYMRVHLSGLSIAESRFGESQLYVSSPGLQIEFHPDRDVLVALGFSVGSKLSSMALPALVLPHLGEDSEERWERVLGFVRGELVGKRG
jgi:hypothetical protein